MEDLKRFLARCRTYLDPRLIPGAPKQDMPSKKRQRVQNVWSLIFTGYHAGFETDPAAFATQLCGVKPIERAIIFEGAFMALASLDLADSNSLDRVLQLHQTDTTLLPSMFQGLGGAMSRLKLPVSMHASEMDQFWGWLSLSGYANYAGYLQWPRFIERQEIPAGLSGISLRAFDQGIGCAIWFIAACAPRLIIEIANNFPEHRKADIWNGVGLAVGVWGMEDSSEFIKLMNGAKKHRAEFQAGVGFGIWSRSNAGELLDHSEGASSTVCGAPAQFIVASINEQLSDLGSAPKNSTDFLKWKNNVAAMFARS